MSGIVRELAGILVAVAAVACVRQSSADAAAEIVREEEAFLADSAALAARLRVVTVVALYVAVDPDEGVPMPGTGPWRHVARSGDFCEADTVRAVPGDTLRCPWTTLREAGLRTPGDDGFAKVEGTGVGGAPGVDVDSLAARTARSGDTTAARPTGTAVPPR